MGEICSRGIITFLIAVAKHLLGSTLRDRWFIQITFQAQWQEGEAVGHIASTVNVGVQISLLFIHSGSPRDGTTLIQDQCGPKWV